MLCKSESCVQLAERNKRMWDDLYAATDEFIWGDQPLGFVSEYIDSIAADLPLSPRILDAATGEGRNLETLLTGSARVHGCDSSLSGLRKIPARLRERVRCVRCDLVGLPFPSDYFDLVVATDVIGTLPNVDAALREICRVLRSGGKFINNIPDMADGIAAQDMTPIGDRRFLFRGSYYYRFFSRAEACKLLGATGFRVTRCETHDWIEPAHPSFRDREHRHKSRVFLAEKAPPQ